MQHAPAPAVLTSRAERKARALERRGPPLCPPKRQDVRVRYGNVVAHGLDVLSRRNHSGEIQHRRVAEQRARPCGRLAAPIRYLPLHSRVATRLIDALLCAAWRVGPSSAARTRRRRNACAYARARGGTVLVEVLVAVFPGRLVRVPPARCRIISDGLCAAIPVLILYAHARMRGPRT